MKPTNAYRNQHFVPTVYLKQFSEDGAASTPSSKIWRLTLKTHEPVTVKTQNRVPFGYSRKDPEGAEKSFQGLESEYSEIMQRVWNLQPARSPFQYFTLISMIISLHCRNPAYENRTGSEAIDVYRFLEMDSAEQFLKEQNSGQPIEPNLLNWRVRIFGTDKDLLTNDNPAIWINTSVAIRPTLMFLPVTPRFCAVAYDTRLTDVQGDRLSDVDATRVNVYLLKSTLGAVFFHRAFTPAEQTQLRENWPVLVKPPGFVEFSSGATFWRPNIIKVEKKFDFETR